MKEFARFEFYPVQQNTDEWQALRLGKATNSNAGTWMANDGGPFGEPAKKLALAIALEQITGRKSVQGFSNEHTERGHEQEPIAKMLYAEETFCTVDNGGFFDWGTYGNSPDGLVGRDGVVEIKSVIAPVHFDNIRRGSFDPAYRWQLIGHLDCTSRAWVDFISFCADFPDGNQLYIHRLERADYLPQIEALRKRRAEFIKLVEQTRFTICDRLELPA